MIVDLIAYDQMDDGLRQKAVDLLRQHPRFEQHFLGKMPQGIWAANDVKKNEWIFAFAGNWPDVVRSRSNIVTEDDVTRFSRPEWHFVDFPIFVNQADEQQLAGSLHINLSTEPPADRDMPSMNVIQAVKNSSRIVADRSAPAAERAVHLAWLCHLVGDSHQPLHSSALYTSKRFPEGDHGGGLLHIGERTSLHSYWDGRVLDNHDFDAIRHAARKLDRDESFKKIGEAVSLVNDPIQWVSEGRQIARTTIYTDQLLKMVAAGEGQTSANLENVDLPATYDHDAGAIVRRRIVMAGYRLAELLKRLLKD